MPFRLELGMPHLGRNNLSESVLFKELGHHRWKTIETLCDTRSAEWRDQLGARIYATFYYVEVHCPPTRPLSYHRENQVLSFSADLAHFGRVQLDGHFRLENDPSTWLRACNVFVVQEDGPSRLRITPPENLDCSRIAELPRQPDARQFCKVAQARGAFFEPEADEVSIYPGWRSFGYDLDPDRDLNGAGLVYFANFIAFLDLAERRLLSAEPDALPEELLDERSTYRRKIGYYGNARSTDRLDISVRARMRVIADGDRRVLDLGLDYTVKRRSDDKLIVVSSARKSAPLVPGSSAERTVVDMIASRHGRRIDV